MAGVLGTVNPASPEAGLAPTRLDQERATPIAEELTTTVASGGAGRRDKGRSWPVAEEAGSHEWSVRSDGEFTRRPVSADERRRMAIVE